MSNDSEARKVIGWWIIVFLAVAMLALLSREAKSQPSVIRAPLNGYGAITTCDSSNRVVIVINSSVTAEELPDIVTHENVHRDEMLAYPGGCLAFLARYRADLSFRFYAEARAYCSGYNAMVSRGMVKENIWNLAEYMQRTYASNHSIREVKDALPCGREVVTAARDGTFTVPP